MSREKRKLDHIDYALSSGSSGGAGFEDLLFVHQSLPDSTISDISLQVRMGELNLSSPFFINAMTGGGGVKTEEINKNFALAAKKTGLALSVGSQMAAIKNRSERQSFAITRKTNPCGLIFGNLGSEATVDQAKTAIDMIEADALQIHLNVIQELSMPEGDRTFHGALQRIEKIVKGIEVPVIVKETGFGMSKETAIQLSDVGVAVIDVGGYGGTNFSRIENHRQTRELTFFNEWGIPTVPSIVEVSQTTQIPTIASGGIQSSLDIVKSLALGASAVGIAGKFLQILSNEGVESLIEEINFMKTEIVTIMTALGTKSVNDFSHVPIILTGKSYHWLKTRGFNPDLFARRNKLS